MAQITNAKVIANNEIAFLAWKTDPGSIEGCLGFHIVREYLDDNGNVNDERPLAAYVAFKGQSNPDWQPQNTAVWPVQRFSWRDLTLRRKRNAAERRPEMETVRYRIRAVGNYKAGLEEVVPEQEKHWDKATRTWLPNNYTGPKRKLGYLTGPAFTNAITVVRQRGPFTSTFTNGILSTQFLIKVLEEDGQIQPGELKSMLETPGNKIRNYLAGDVLTTIEEFFARPGGRFKAALYELEDEQLLDILKQAAPRLDLILSDAGADDDAGTYDTRNAHSRAKLRAIADQAGSGFTMQDRLFNGTGHIGHNKFVVHVNGNGMAKAVLTGSTNWTWSGIAGQSNNLIVIEDDGVAKAYLDYWKRLQADVLPMPTPLSAKNSGANQSDILKSANRIPVTVDLGGGSSAECWFSPNMPGKQQPPAKKPPTSTAPPPPPPPDAASLFEIVRKADSLIMFAVFLPSRGGLNSIVEEAIAMGSKDPSLTVVGAISDRQAMWQFRPSQKKQDGTKVPAWAPHTFRTANVDVIRATALTDREIRREIGDFSNDETLTLGKAIIHDKILVVDPFDPVKCVVAFGSHNLGYKASYSNDENLVIVRGHEGLAQAYAAHILDVWDHYRFRAAEAERSEKNQQGWDGFLKTNDSWQTKASRRLARLFTGA